MVERKLSLLYLSHQDPLLKIEYYSSHVVKTGDIKDLVILEEAGIAKGIRRIIAVTGEEAKFASLKATETEAVFRKLTKLAGKEQDKALKLYEPVSSCFVFRRIEHGTDLI